MNLNKYIRSIPNYPKKGILFRDVTTIFSNANAFKYCINRISKICKKKRISKIAGIEARGFIIGAAVALKLNLPFITIRKKGKLPSKKYAQKYKLEYGFDTLEIHKDSIKKKEKIALVDDLIATGGTAIASKKLIIRLGGNLELFASIVDLKDLGGSNKLRKARVDTVSLVKLPGH